MPGGPDTPAAPGETIAVHVTWKGRVQGVWFRGFIRKHATELGLTGWVRNRHNGTVEAEITGPRPAVEDLLRKSRKGPPAARVDEVVVAEMGVPELKPKDLVQRGTALIGGI